VASASGLGQLGDGEIERSPRSWRGTARIARLLHAYGGAITSSLRSRAPHARSRTSASTVPASRSARWSSKSGGCCRLSRIRLLPEPRQGPDDPARDPGAAWRDVASDRGSAVSMVGSAARLKTRTTTRAVRLRRWRPLARASLQTARRGRTCRASSARGRCRGRTPRTPPPAAGELRPPSS
jgi:hypothetical protein